MSSSYTSTEVGNWLGELDEDGGFKNQETFARAVLDGYEVEKDKRYLVKVKGHIHENILVYGYGVKRYFFSSSLEGNRRAKHTRKELEQAGFGWGLIAKGLRLRRWKDEKIRNYFRGGICNRCIAIRGSVWLE